MRHKIRSFLVFISMLLVTLGCFKTQKPFVFQPPQQALPEQIEVYQKAANFLIEKKPCVLAAIGDFPDEGFFTRTNYSGSYNYVLCVADLTFNEGTINEQKGCYLSNYDMSTNEYSIRDGFQEVHVSRKPCLSGGLRELAFDKKLNCSIGYDPKDPFEKCIIYKNVMELGGRQVEAFPVLLYADNKEVEDIFKQVMARLKD